VTPDEAVRRAAVEGLNLAMMVKEHDEEQAKAGPSGDLDDGIPF
jgi:hypothetical protein